MTDDEQMTRAMEAAVAAATRAPSIHNTQPWHFRLAGNRIELLADRSHQLDVLDPTSRQLHISCGAALHHLKVALRACGYDVTVLPGLGDDIQEHLASIVVRAGEPPSLQDTALATAIRERHTQREPFDERQVDASTLGELRNAAEAEGAWVSLLERREDQITLAVLLSHADQAERADSAYQAELQRWRHAEPGAGVPDSAIPAAGTDRHSEVVIRDFTVGDVADVRNDSDASEPDASPPPQPDERPALIVLGTDADSPAQWLAAGQALSALLLRATELGLRASMLGQVIDLPGTRSQLRSLLRFVGEPQMVLRIGYGPVGAATPRRSLANVLN